MTGLNGLEAILDRSRALGFLGPGPISPHITHALGFGEALLPEPHDGGDRVEQQPGEREVEASRPGPVVLDLGAGGGLPSLPLLVARRELWMVLLDASQRRCSFLVGALVELGLSDRAEVWCGRAEELARTDDRRGSFAGVVARGFGPPATTLECAAGFLAVGGRCVVSEPPGGRAWPANQIEALGLVERPGAGPGFVTFERVGTVPDWVPRSARDQQRRPLFRL